MDSYRHGKSIEKLKTNKIRDPHGLINEIFKPGVIGVDLKLGFTEMLSRFFFTLWSYPAKKNEWTNQVREDLEELGLRNDDLD